MEEVGSEAGDVTGGSSDGPHRGGGRRYLARRAAVAWPQGRTPWVIGGPAWMGHAGQGGVRAAQRQRRWRLLCAISCSACSGSLRAAPPPTHHSRRRAWMSSSEAMGLPPQSRMRRRGLAASSAGSAVSWLWLSRSSCSSGQPLRGRQAGRGVQQQSGAPGWRGGPGGGWLRSSSTAAVAASRRRRQATSRRRRRRRRRRRALERGAQLGDGVVAERQLLELGGGDPGAQGGDGVVGQHQGVELFAPVQAPHQRDLIAVQDQRPAAVGGGEARGRRQRPGEAARRRRSSSSQPAPPQPPRAPRPRRT